MSITIETKQNQDGSFSPTTIENQYELKQLVNHGIQLIGVLQIIGNEVVNLTTGLNQAIINNENAIKLIDTLCIKYKDKKIIILDSPSDRKALDNILKNVLDNERVYFYPNSTIFEAIEIIKKSILVVSPDTAIIHIADGFDKKIISFYKNEKITYDKWKISEDNEIHFYENNINELDFSNINL